MSATYRQQIAALTRRLGALSRVRARANRDSLVLDALNRREPGAWCRQCGCSIGGETPEPLLRADGLSFCSATCVRDYEYLA